MHEITCGAKALLEPFIKNGKIVNGSDMQEARERVRRKLTSFADV